MVGFVEIERKKKNLFWFGLFKKKESVPSVLVFDSVILYVNSVVSKLPIQSCQFSRFCIDISVMTIQSFFSEENYHGVNSVKNDWIDRRLNCKTELQDWIVRLNWLTELQGRLNCHTELSWIQSLRRQFSENWSPVSSHR